MFPRIISSAARLKACSFNMVIPKIHSSSILIFLDLESHSHSREKIQFFETRLRIIFLTLTWRDEIEIIIWSFLYFETRTRLHIVILMFRDKIETLENHFSWSSEKKWSWLSLEFSLTSASNRSTITICKINVFKKVKPHCPFFVKWQKSVDCGGFTNSISGIEKESGFYPEWSIR